MTISDMSVKRSASTWALRSNMLLLVATVVVGVATYLLNSISARRLHVGDFSQLGIMLNLLTAFSPIAAVVSGAVVRVKVSADAAIDPDLTDRVQRAITWELTLIYAIILVVVFVFHPWIRGFFRFTSIIPVFVVLLTGYWLTIWGLLQATLQEQRAYGRLSVIFLLSGIVRCALGIGAILSGWGINGVLLPYAITVIITTFFFPRPRALWTGTRAAGAAMRRVHRDMAILLTGNLSFITLAYIDVVLCRRSLDPHTADGYVAVSSLAKFFLFLTVSVSTIAFVETARARAQGIRLGKILGLSFGIIIGLGIPFMVCCFLGGPLLMVYAFGESYRASGHVLWVVAASTVATSLVNLEIAVFTAYGSYRYLVVFAPIILLVAVMFTIHGETLARYADIYAAGATALALLLLVAMQQLISARTREIR